jgi:hypothetical protein
MSRKYLIIYPTATFKLVDNYTWTDEHSALIIVKFENGQSTLTVNKAQETDLEKMAIEAVRDWARGLRRIDPVKNSVAKVVERWEAAAKDGRQGADPLPLGTLVNSIIDIADLHNGLIPAGSPGVVCSHQEIEKRPATHVRFTFMKQLPRGSTGPGVFTRQRAAYRLSTSIVPVLPSSVCIISLPPEVSP